ncbi:MAG TPA: right-handed parallel beta-helix repeat-containing protein [Phycisphaerales bacterium]|nr:right-handed parallel beta-helix repeat-containing protein [Phycisphaerales bacterium]
MPRTTAPSASSALIPLFCSAPLVALAPTGSAFAGPLNPPAGAVGATGKALAEVEPRTAINAVNTPGDADATPSTFKITQPGSYYLTGNISGESGKHGIEIASVGVTLDLNGFSVTGVPGSLTGVILRTGGTEVRNGTVRNWGGAGVSAEPAVNTNRVIDVRAISNGGIGIYAGNYSEARNCLSTGNGSHGIAVYAFGRVEGCAARNNGGNGIDAPNSGNAIVNSVANENTGNGINAGGGNIVIGCTVSYNDQNGVETDGTVVRDCNGVQNGEYGFNLGTGSTASGNRAAGNTVGGFYTFASCVLEGNYALGNGAGVATRNGFTISGAGNRVSNNHATGNPIGFSVFGGPSVLTGNTAIANTATGFFVNGNTNTLLTGNTAAGNPTNYTVNAGNDSGAVITNPGVGFSTTNPAANYAN